MKQRLLHILAVLFALLMPEGVSQAKDIIVIDPIDGLSSVSFSGDEPSATYQRVSDVDAQWGIPNNNYVCFEPTSTTINVYALFHSDKVEPGMRYRLQVVFAPETREDKGLLPCKVNIDVQDGSNNSIKSLTAGFPASATEVTTFEADTVEMSQKDFYLKIETSTSNSEIRGKKFNRVFRIAEIRLIPLEAYAVLSDDHATLTFYYDENKDSRNGMSVGPFNNGSAWGDYVKDITTVVFDDSFAKCTSITSTAYWFYHFENLTTIEGLKNLNTENVTSMLLMFYQCSSLESLDLSSFKTGNVTNMEQMFSHCSKLKSLNVSSFDTRNVRSMFLMFNGLSSLTSLDVSNFTNDNVTNMRMMFGDCSNLTSLNLSNFTTGKVEDMESMFSSCSSLTSLDLSSFEACNVTNMWAMFSLCSKLESIKFGNFNNGKTEKMESMFSDCTSLTSLDLSSFNTSNVTNMSKMFAYCSSLKSLDLSSFDTSKLNTLFYLFFECMGLESVNVSSFNTAEVTDMRCVFYNCVNLKNLDVSNFDTSKAEDIGGMFFGCSSLTSLDVNNFNTSNVKDMWGLFGDCANLETIYCDNTWDPTVSSEKMFLGCKKLSGYNSDEVDATKAKPIADGGYFTLKNDTRVNNLSEKGDADHRVFNLQGHPVKQPRKGIYIREGKKWMMK